MSRDIKLFTALLFFGLGNLKGKVWLMKRRKIWGIMAPLLVLAVSLMLSVGLTYFLDRTWFIVELALFLPAILSAAALLLYRRRGIRLTIESVAEGLEQSKREALQNSLLPVLACAEDGEILWYNEKFKSQVLGGRDVYGDSVAVVTGGIGAEKFKGQESVEISLGNRSFTAYISSVLSGETVILVLYFIENTKYKNIEKEFTLSRPGVVLFYIDNLEEILKNARESERAQITGKVENLLEDWTSKANGVFRRYGSDRYMLIAEKRDIEEMIAQKFDILVRVRSIQTGSNINVTLSIGVGQGSTLRESEQYARQALDMALGRGGDQAAVKTENGFDFYGGLTQGIQRRSKVRTRVVASTLRELIDNSDRVLVMGHRYSDLDSLGSAAALVSCIRSLDKQAFVVANRSQTLTPELIQRYIEAGFGELFVEPEEALSLISDKALLIITDTHNPGFLESEEIWRAAKSVVVIDHHRKMVDHIDNAVVFHNEPYASSTSEMVAEIIQYLEGATISKLDAEALMAGIMLDTRNFVIRAGVRTFEAAAFLRRMGADTVKVKKLLAGNLQTYKEKADILARAQVYGNFAVAVADSENGGNLRVAAAQAADELLYIQGVDASFVIFPVDKTVNISARSLGRVNVQVLMEQLGGGGHFNMAGAQLADTTPNQAKRLLLSVIRKYTQDTSQR